jgi:hypothetical protein
LSYGESLANRSTRSYGRAIRDVNAISALSFGASSLLVQRQW